MAYAPGQYAFKITNQGFDKSKVKQTDFFFLEGEPVEYIHEDGSREPVEKPFLRRIDFYITEKTIDRVIKQLTELGWTGGKLGTLNLDNPSAYSFVGQCIVVECTADGQYDRFNLPGSGERAPTKSDPSIANKLDAMFGNKLPKATKPATAAAKPRPATAAAPASSDDIPF